MIRWPAATASVWLCATTWGAIAAPLPADAPGAKQEAERLNRLPPVASAPTGHVDHSGRNQKGRASYYAHRFTHRKMADGHRLNPNANVAASKTLPLGSVATVRNLDNGKTATVKIEDRGPYVAGRVVDVTPKVADKLDIGRKGVVPVEVKPITLPQPDGHLERGAGAADASPEEVNHAVEVTKQLTGSANSETAQK